MIESQYSIANLIIQNVSIAITRKCIAVKIHLKTFGLITTLHLKISIWEHLKMDLEMDMASLSPIKFIIKDNLNIIKEKVREFLSFQMETCIKESLRIIFSTVKVSILGLMDKNMMDSLRKDLNKVMASNIL